MIKKGQRIHCGKCGAGILVATEDIHPCSPMVSSRLALLDGTPLGYQAEKTCPACGHIYQTIYTTGRTD